MRAGPLVAATVALLLGAAVRRLHTRRLAQRSDGTPPGVRTDDGVLLHVETDEAPDAEVTVVLCHGFAAREEMFRSQRRALRGRARVVLFDQRGHHESGWAGRRSLSMDRLGHDLGTVVDRAAGPGPVVLVGHSLGALAIVALAGRRPELFGSRVAGVALLSGSSGGLLHTVLPRRLADALLATGAARVLLWLVWLLAPVVDLVRPVEHRWGQRVLRRRLYGTGSVTEDERAATRRMWLGTSQSKAAALVPAVLLFCRDDDLDVLRTVPTLVLAGTADATIPVEHSEHLAGRIGASARLRLVEGAGHMVPITHEETVNEELLRLLGRVRASRPHDVG